MDATCERSFWFWERPGQIYCRRCRGVGSSFRTQSGNNGDIIDMVSILWGLTSHRRPSPHVVEIRDWSVGHVLLFLLSSKNPPFQRRHTPIHIPSVRRTFFWSYSKGEGLTFDLWLYSSFPYRDNSDCFTIIEIHRH